MSILILTSTSLKALANDNQINSLLKIDTEVYVTDLALHNLNGENGFESVKKLISHGFIRVLETILMHKLELYKELNLDVEEYSIRNVIDTYAEKEVGVTLIIDEDWIERKINNIDIVSTHDYLELNKASSSEVKVKIVIPEASPIKRFFAENVLHMLLLPETFGLVMIESVVFELILNEPKLATFFKGSASRIDSVRTSVCIDDADKRLRGIKVGQERIALAIADFLLNYIDDAIGDSKALVIYEQKNKTKPYQIQGFPDNVKFITTDEYLNMLMII